MTEKDKRIDYIELQVTDIGEAKRFYGDVFGWKFVDYGPDYTSFNDGRLDGGFTKVESVQKGGPLIVIYSLNLEKIKDKVISLGGTIVKDIFSLLLSCIVEKSSSTSFVLTSFVSSKPSILPLTS